MTAMCASSASPTTSPPANSPRDLVASLRTVVVPGTPATYANRAYLRNLGLRWDPAHYRWQGTTTSDHVKELREKLGLEIRVFGQLEAPPKGPSPPLPASPVLPSVLPAVPAIDPPRRSHDGSRTRLEARIAFPEVSEDAEEIATPTRRFTALEITSGLPDDCREEDERVAERWMRDLRGRVKRARAAVATIRGLAETLAGDWKKAARFYERFGVTETQFRHEIPEEGTSPGEGTLDPDPMPGVEGPQVRV